MSNEAEDDRVFKALAHARRRELLDCLRDGPVTTGGLCERFDDMDRCSVMQHLKVLEGAGLVVALIITLTLTSIAGSAQAAIVQALGLEGIEWLRPAMTLIALSISIFANYLLFLWIFWMLPRHKPKKKALLRGTLLAAIGFEVIKFVMTMTLPQVAKSPSGAAFGSVIGLMAFFYFFARLTLFCAAWIATAQYKEDKTLPTSEQSAP